MQEFRSVYFTETLQPLPVLTNTVTMLEMNDPMIKWHRLMSLFGYGLCESVPIKY